MVGCGPCFELPSTWNIVQRSSTANHPINQANVGAIPVTETALEGAVGTTADTGWVGSGLASLIAILKAIAPRWRVGGVVQDGSGAIATSGVAQNLFGGLTPTNGYIVKNTSSAVLYINNVGAATIGQPNW
jgi:hypothetical protein